MGISFRLLLVNTREHGCWNVWYELLSFVGSPGRKGRVDTGGGAKIFLIAESSTKSSSKAEAPSSNKGRCIISASPANLRELEISKFTTAFTQVSSAQVSGFHSSPSLAPTLAPENHQDGSSIFSEAPVLWRLSPQLGSPVCPPPQEIRISLNVAKKAL